MENTEMKWYIIRCASGAEKRAKKHIESELKQQNLEKYVANLIIPTKKENYIRKGKKVSRDVNFFPGYVMIQSDLNVEIQHIIKNTDGVISILGPKDKPEALREEEVMRILGKIDDFKNISNTVIDFIIGESVVIADGPFQGFNATIEEISEEKKRMKVSIKIFGRSTPMEIEFTQAIKI